MLSGQVRASDVSDTAAWDVVVGARFIATFRAPAPTRVLEAFEELARAPRPELEALIAGIPLGRAGVESFALVWWPAAGEPLTAVVRGDAAVDLASPGGRRRLDSRGIRPWHLAEFRDVQALRIGAAGASLDALGEATTAVEGPVARLRAASVEWHPDDAPQRAAGADRDTAEVPEPAGTGSGAPASATTESAATESLAPAFAATESAHAATESASAAAPTPAGPPPPDPVFGYRIAGGEARVASGAVLIGRRPAPPRIPTAPVELVQVPAGASAVSATHLELRLEGSRIVATDLRSTNGTVVRTATGTRRMRSGESIVVSPGVELDLGGDTIVEILPPPVDQAHPDRQATA
ncbi:FHA domain-containing protein [Agromyces sp. G08B096]|uniref:FHA domain-containing protein n=1 Tax=Agromyces sp. G08B096 TaxID=3156399 RepID=A0AAU7W3D0_9MICO